MPHSAALHVAATTHDGMNPSATRIRWRDADEAVRRRHATTATAAIASLLQPVHTAVWTSTATAASACPTVQRLRQGEGEGRSGGVHPHCGQSGRGGRKEKRREECIAQWPVLRPVRLSIGESSRAAQKREEGTLSHEGNRRSILSARSSDGRWRVACDMIACSLLFRAHCSWFGSSFVESLSAVEPGIACLGRRQERRTRSRPRRDEKEDWRGLQKKRWTSRAMDLFKRSARCELGKGGGEEGVGSGFMAWEWAALPAGRPHQGWVRSCYLLCFYFSFVSIR